jgi:hypothetical protein
MLLMRPNLLLLTAAPVAAWLWPCLRGRNSWADGLATVFRFAAGIVPAAIVLALVNARLYGSPLETGYGGFGGDMYRFARAPRNLHLYLGWLLQSQTVLVALAAAPLFVRGAIRPDSPRASVRAGLTTLFSLMLVSYIFYYVFDAWFYLRFLLPAMPALFVLMAAGIRALCLKLPVAAQLPAAIILMLCSVVLPLRYAVSQSIFRQYDFEQRYVIAAHYVEELTTPNAIILSLQHSGSVRYHGHRTTLRYDYLAPDGLDPVLRELIAKGYQPYIVMDDSEEPDFRRRFAAHSRVGRLDWRPLVRIPTNPQVRIYDPEGRATLAKPTSPK